MGVSATPLPTWGDCPPRRIHLPRGNSIGWVDLSGFTAEVIDGLADTLPPPDAPQRSFDLWCEALMERQRRGRRSQ